MGSPHTDHDLPTGKGDLRRLAMVRRRRPTEVIDAARAALSGHLLPLLTAHPVVCMYLPLPTEPLHPDLVAQVSAAGTTVLLPVARTDGPMDWVQAGQGVRQGPYGIEEPVGPQLGPQAAADAGVVLVPAFLIDDAGQRLGRGGGHYDRSLVHATGLTVGVVFDDERVPSLPVEDFDVPVGAVATPGGGISVFAGR